MKYNPENHHRQSIRLQGYDYAQPGAYFVTIVTHNHECLFGDVVDGEMRLNPLGNIVGTCWHDLPNHYPHVQLDAFVIMPNHVHGIIVLVDDNPGIAGMDIVVGAGVGAGLRPYEIPSPRIT